MEDQPENPAALAPRRRSACLRTYSLTESSESASASRIYCWSGTCDFHWMPLPEPVVQLAEPEPQPDAPARVPRWHELVRKQDGERFDSFP